MVVGFAYVMLFTTMPPLAAAAIRLGNPTPGSKNPDPDTTFPFTVTATEFCPLVTLAGIIDAGLAGGGAINFTMRTAYELVASLNSWIVHMVMSSPGSRLVYE